MQQASKSIHFEPLEPLIKQPPFKSRFLKRLAIGTGILAAVCISISIIGAIIGSEELVRGPLVVFFTVLFFITPPVLLVMLFVVLFQSFKGPKGKKLSRVDAIEEFSNINGWRFSEQASAQETYPHSLFGVGTSPKYFDVVEGKIDGLPFELKRYQYMEPSRKKRVPKDFVLLKITLSKVFPHLALDSHGNNFARTSNLPIFYTDDQRIELEGDFNKRFDMYAPENYQVAALDIYSPDLMSLAMDFSRQFDIEIIGNSAYIIANPGGVHYYEPTLIKELFTLADKLVTTFKTKELSWRFDIDPKNPPVLRQYKNESAIRIGRFRLSTAYLVVPIAAYGIVGAIDAEQIAGPTGLIMAVGIGIFLLIMRQITLRRNHRKNQRAYLSVTNAHAAIAPKADQTRSNK